MSLLPFFHDLTRPPRILTQQFGLVLHPEPEDWLASLPVPRGIRSLLGHPGYLRPWRSQNDASSTISLKDGHFQANLDVQQFAPEEITVKVTGENTITIELKHEERQDEHGYISRQFVRKYVLPKECDMQKIESKLSSDGVLTITAPKTGEHSDEHRKIPIIHTGKPSRAMENKKEEGEEKKK